MGVFFNIIIIDNYHNKGLKIWIIPIKEKKKKPSNNDSFNIEQYSIPLNYKTF